MKKRTRELIKKARNAALLAVEVYNKPLAAYRSEGFIVQMMIAWVALLQAVMEERGTDYVYRQPDGGAVLIDGEPKSWELSRLALEYFGGQTTAVTKNLEFFVGLRNKIEHRFLPPLDYTIAGECQALLLNFESLITTEFGERSALMDSVFIAIQASSLRTPAGAAALRKLESRLPVGILRYITNYRSGLDDNILNSQEFSFKVFLVPNVANRRGSADAAVEFIKYDPEDPTQAEELARLGVLIKTKQVAVANKGRFLPGKVASRVSEAIGRPFTASTHHARAWRHYKVRPESASANREDCKTEYCQFDEAHGGYVYTAAWVTFLIEKLADEEEYNEVCGHRSTTA